MRNGTLTRSRTVVYIATSLDRYIARPDGALDWLGEPSGDQDYGWAEFLDSIDHIVMGRGTFEKVGSFVPWPYEGTPLTVLSTTMKAVPEHLQGKAEISSLDPAALLEDLGAQGCERVYVDGGLTVQSFLRSDLIDEMIITTIPVLIGEGISLFGAIDADMEWEHLTTESFAQGLVKSTYRRR